MTEKVTIADMIEDIQIDNNAKKVFLAMPREEQLLSILGMIAFLRSQFANLQRDVIKDREDAKAYREQREEREQKLADILETDPDIQALSHDEKQNTIQKIFSLATRPARNGGLLDKVLSLILVILFVLFITGRLP